VYLLTSDYSEYAGDQWSLPGTFYVSSLPPIFGRVYITIYGRPHGAAVRAAA
jgi:hypothetical protein